MNTAAIYGPDPIYLEGRTGSRYWVHHDYEFTGNAEVDARLSGYPVAVFQPVGCEASDTPIVISLQGIAAPYQFNSFIIPTLLDMGICCVFFDSPLGGERSLTRTFKGDALIEAQAFRKHGVPLSTKLVLAMMDAVGRDFATIIRLIQERHGLVNDRIALLGASWGTLLSSYAFMRFGIGSRLLGTIGHADLIGFTGSYTPFITPLLISPLGRMIGKVANVFLGPGPTIVDGALDFLSVLQAVSKGDNLTQQANPMTYRHLVEKHRRVRFLVGENDPLVKPAAAIACAKLFPDGEAYVVPGLGHGNRSFGPDFVEHVRHFIGTQLGDWKW